METTTKIVIVIVSLIAVTALIAVSLSLLVEKPPEATVNANGISQIKAMPDLVGIYYNIETNGSTAAIAGEKNAKISDDLITALVKLGFERKEIQTQSYSVNPDYIYDYSIGKQTQIGYKATHQIKLEFSTQNTHLIGDAIDAGINVGATINNINFELSITKQNVYKIEALKQATEDAKLKAEAIATGLGKSLGRVVSVSSSDFNYYPWKMYDAITSMNAAVAKAETTSIQPSDQEVTAQVSVVYAII